ncbi:MAG: hypothetical protein GX386_08845 [Clostridiaceae bacterium]|jgi:hypothetical protein|nr:hypothetical protein [Clostridiaceae bacterium]
MEPALVNPYLPSGRVTKAIASGDISEEILNSLKESGTDIIFTEPHPSLPSPLSYHADMQMVNVSEGVFVYAPGVSEKMLEKLKKLGFELIRGSVTLKNYYPFDVAYNCAVVGENAFLNPRYTDPIVLELLVKNNIRLNPVKQGYAKCSTAVVSEEAIITADLQIYRKAVDAGLDALLIQPQKNIILKGYDYGFIGGCSGLISDKEIAFFGDISTLENGDAISKFCTKHGKEAISLAKGYLVDLGGLFPLTSV